jgi:hypothetical protein
VADLIVVAAIIAIVSRRAWTSISALALAERGYGQNSAARQRAADLADDGYRGFVSGHTHHPELSRCGDGFYANSGSCTTVVEATTTRLTMPSAYLRAQQVSWLELADGRAELWVARIDLPGATRLERFAAHGRHHFPAVPAVPAVLASWPGGPAWPTLDTAGAITTGRSTSSGPDGADRPPRP